MPEPPSAQQADTTASTLPYIVVPALVLVAMLAVVCIPVFRRPPRPPLPTSSPVSPTTEPPPRSLSAWRLFFGEVPVPPPPPQSPSATASQLTSGGLPRSDSTQDDVTREYYRRSMLFAQYGRGVAPPKPRRSSVDSAGPPPPYRPVVPDAFLSLPSMRVSTASAASAFVIAASAIAEDDDDEVPLADWPRRASTIGRPPVSSSPLPLPPPPPAYHVVRFGEPASQ
ncbi:hypothetical protein BC828DRAFT_409955 [Blastocladiella britannica]|nr:hypothetical protein BC828DRAFT_409955 [Blastocladiella britannica]